MPVRLYGTDGAINVRGPLTVDDPIDWSPDNLNVGEDIDLVLFDGWGWQQIHLVAVFGGAPAGVESVDVTALIEVKDPANPVDAAAGRLWATLPPVSLAHGAVSTPIESRGRRMGFRVSGLVLAATPSVTIRVAGGDQETRPIS